MNTFNFDGKNLEYFKLWLTNTLLTIFTLGLYYPIAKTKTNKYIFSSININNINFDFNTNVKQSYIVFLLYTLIYASLLLSIYFITKHASNPLYIGLDLVFFFILIISFISYASYQNSLTLIKSLSYKEKRFKTRFRLRDFVLITIKALFITGLSLGVTAFTAIVIFVKTINDIGVITKLLSSDLTQTIHSFEMKIMIIIAITTVLLGVFSFIIGFAYYKLRLKSYILKNSIINKTKFKLKLKLLDYILLSTINFTIIVFSLGFATPWVKIKHTKSILNNTKINDKSSTSESQ